MVHWVTQRVVTGFDLIHVHQWVVREGGRSDWWNVEVFTFQTWARVRLKRQTTSLQIITPIFFLTMNKYTWALRSYYKQHPGFGQDISNTQITLLSFHYYSWGKKCLKGICTSCRKSTLIRQFYFSEKLNSDIDFKGPIEIFQSFNLTEYLFHGNWGEGRQFIKLMCNQTCFIGPPTAQVMRRHKMNSRSSGEITLEFWKAACLQRAKEK